MKAVVLAGGLGMRLRERVPDVPKPMAPVAGRPFLEYVLDRLILGGVEDIILSVGYRAELIANHFGDSYGGATLRYSIEAEPLGTGGAILHALRDEREEDVLVVNGDTYLHIDFGDFVRWHDLAPAKVAMVVRAIPDTGRYGSVTVSGDRIIGFAEKGRSGPGFVNAGVYAIHPSIFPAYNLQENFSLEADLIQPHLAEIRPRAYITDRYFIDIGIPEDYDRAQHELLSVSK